jgi:hypothetical protein
MKFGFFGDLALDTKGHHISTGIVSGRPSR